MAVIQSRLYRGRAAPTRVLPGQPVLAARQWSELVSSANWLIAKGACLVPLCNPAMTIPKGGSRTFRFRVRPRGQAIGRQWSVFVRGDPAADGSVTLTSDGGSVTTHAVPAVGTSTAIRPATAPLSLTEWLAGRVSTEVEISLTVAANVADVTLEGIDCHELDRTGIVDNSTDDGTQIETVRPREPLLHQANLSVRGVYEGLRDCDPRRVGLLHLPMDTGTPITRTPNSFGSSLTNLPWRVQAPKLNAGATNGAVKWSAYARMTTSGGTGGAVRLTTSVSGVSDTATVTGTSFAWTASRNIDIRCDDFAADDGYVNDELTAAIRGDGTRTVAIAGLSVWVDSVA